MSGHSLLRHHAAGCRPQRLDLPPGPFRNGSGCLSGGAQSEIGAPAVRALVDGRPRGCDFGPVLPGTLHIHDAAVCLNTQASAGRSGLTYPPTPFRNGRGSLFGEPETELQGRAFNLRRTAGLCNRRPRNGYQSGKRLTLEHGRGSHFVKRAGTRQPSEHRHLSPLRGEAGREVCRRETGLAA